MSSRQVRAGRLTGLAACLIVLARGGVVHAEDSGALFPPNVSGDGHLVLHPPEARSEASDETPRSESVEPSIDHRSILLDLEHLPCTTHGDQALVNEVAPDYDCPGSVVHAYRGVASIAVRRALGYYRRFFADEMKNRWFLGNDTVFDVERRMQLMANATADLSSGGRWWDRTWRESLVPQEGGAPAGPRLDVRGEEIELFHVGEFSLSNSGRFTAGRLSLYLDDDRIYERIEQRTRDALFAPNHSRSDANLQRVTGQDKDKAQEKPQRVLFGDENRFDVTIDLLENDAEVDLERVLSGTGRARIRPPGGAFKTPRGSLATFESWNVSLRPNVQLRFPSSLGTAMTALSYAEVTLEIGLYPGETRQLWGTIRFNVRTSPFDRDKLAATADFEVYRW